MPGTPTCCLMPTNTLHEALERLDRTYQDVCEAFSAGHLTADEARERVLGLVHTDSMGGTWRIDSRRSGRQAAFVHEMADVAGADDQNPHLVLHRALDRLDRKYQRIHTAFAERSISPAEARDLVHQLSYLDSLGRTWRVDMHRSGTHAAFMHEIGGRRIQSNQSLHESLHRELDSLDRQYRQICNSFEVGVITPEQAREQVAALRHTDSLGRTWRIDPRRSGRHAAFEQVRTIDDPTAPFDVTAIRRAIYDDDLSTDALVRPKPPARIDVTGPLPALSDGPDGLGDPLAPRRPRVSPPQQPTYTPRLRETPDVTSRRPVARSHARLLAGVSVVVALAGGVAVATNLQPTDTVTATSLDGSAPVPGESTTPGSTPGSTVAAPASVIADYATRSAVPFETEIEFGRSVRGVPLSVYRRGIDGATRVLVVGNIHGDEPAGIEVVNLLRTMSLNIDIDLWLVSTMNPDGTTDGTRQNANKVDMNRNFPQNWEPIRSVGYWQYAGPSAASEPEVQAMMDLGELINPSIVIWYHQDYFRISPSSGREGAIRSRYATLVDLPLLTITGGNYSGTGAMWAETVLARNGAALTVEFGASLREGEAQRNADAVLTIVREFFS